MPLKGKRVERWLEAPREPEEVGGNHGWMVGASSGRVGGAGSHAKLLSRHGGLKHS